MTKLSKRIIPIGLSILVALAICAVPAYAYFTDVLRASGQHEIELGFDSEFKEDHDLNDGKDKVAYLKNTGNTDVMFRVLVFYQIPNSDPENPNITVNVSSPTMTNWSHTAYDPALGYEVWTYIPVVYPIEGQNTSEELKVNVETKGAVSEADADFDITLVAQTSPVAYDEDGNQYAYAWTNVK